MGGPSDDIAEVSWNLPTVRVYYPSNIPGMTGHHWSSGIAMATPIAHKGANHGAQVVAMTAIDVVTDPGLVADAWRYFREVTTKNYTWTSLIPEALIYDETRYDTYLEQLGVEYPTTEKKVTSDGSNE
jgi:aminobenzoyl-glutamate utilization protein B